MKSKAESKNIMGEIQINNGTRAYNATSGFYGLFASLDRAQSLVTGWELTDEVAQIRTGERLQMEAKKINEETALPIASTKPS